MKKGSLLVLSGFSGSGKGTLVKRMMADYDHYALSISATTREPREGEVDGREYFFVDHETFDQMIKDDQLIEFAKYIGNYYGTPKTYVEEQLELGKDVILEIEVQGAMKVRRAYPDAVLVFLVPPSMEELHRRLVLRGTETPELVNRRMRKAVEESVYMASYDYLVVNDKIEECAERVNSLIERERLRVNRQMDLVHQIQEELRNNWKGE